MTTNDQVAQLSTEVKAEQAAEVRSLKANGNSLAAYYAGSAVASVQKHYKRGAVRMLRAK